MTTRPDQAPERPEPQPIPLCAVLLPGRSTVHVHRPPGSEGAKGCAPATASRLTERAARLLLARQDVTPCPLCHPVRQLRLIGRIHVPGHLREPLLRRLPPDSPTAWALSHARLSPGTGLGRVRLVDLAGIDEAAELSDAAFLALTAGEYRHSEQGLVPHLRDVRRQAEALMDEIGPRLRLRALVSGAQPGQPAPWSVHRDERGRAW
ncbi:hypothetical protein [Streptacidiphilus sp. MAP5-52]|uniref:hypothetical protein n=1 Tax=Streptacidiphilus sp. MAP5-52 TaxID=3156267 RepID=UPI0035134AA9